MSETFDELAARVAADPDAASDADTIRLAAGFLDLFDRAIPVLARLLGEPSRVIGDRVQRDLRAIADRLDGEGPTMTGTLASFLLARIAETISDAGDVQAQAIIDGDDPLDPRAELRLVGHVLADCEAKRRTLTEHGPLRNPIEQVTYCRMCVSPYGFAAKNPTMATGQPYPCSTLRLLVLPYAGHPDYREEWRPLT